MRYESDYYAYNPYNPTTTLKQHGIIGMKWGVWNQETRARYLGGNKRKSKSDQAVTKVIGSKNNHKIIAGNKGNNDLKTADSKYVNRFTKKINEKALLKDLSEDKDFTDKISSKQKKIVKSMVEDNNYGAFLYGELNRVTNQGMVRNFYDSKNFDKITDSELTDFLTKVYGYNPFESNDTNAVVDYLNDLCDFSKNCEKIIDKKIEKIGFSDANAGAAKDFMYKAYVEPMWLLRIQLGAQHSDFSNPYYAVDSYDPQTTAEQHGIMGMKWGVWNAETRARYMGSGSKSKWFSKITDRFNKPKEEPHLKRTHLTKELADISDAELNAAIKRMQLEQTYLQMLRNYPDASDRGKKYANQFTDNLFNQLTTGLGGAMGKRIAKAIDDWVNADDSGKKKQIEKQIENELKGKSDEDIKKYTARQANEDNYKKYRMKELSK